MVDFKQLLTAGDDDLVRIMYKTDPGDETDLIKRLDKIAAQLGLNHTQLVCALGFNKFIRDLSDVHAQLGFRNHKLLSYRQNELFTTDNYKQLSIDNVIDIYSARHKDREVLDGIRKLLLPRLEHIEADIDKTNDPAHIISYRMEIHAVYHSDIADKTLANERLSKDIGKFRLLANEANAVIEAGHYPANNLFFMDTLSPEEKKNLIENHDISQELIKNRLQNPKLSTEERDLLEHYI